MAERGKNIQRNKESPAKSACLLMHHECQMQSNFSAQSEHGQVEEKGGIQRLKREREQTKVLRVRDRNSNGIWQIHLCDCLHL